MGNYAIWKSTNELRNIDKNVLINKPEYKPKKNPIHLDFVDKIEDVFKKFEFETNHYYGRGGHNHVYRNTHFVLRITNLHLNQGDDESFDISKHIDIDEKYNDEKMFLKFLKVNLCPNIYFLGNIEVKNKIYRYMIMENYDYTLKTFLDKKIYLTLLQRGYYNTEGEIIDDIREQIIFVIHKITSMKCVYYDFTSKNIVLREKDDGRLEVRFIDWDSDLCRYEDWIIEDDIYQMKGIIFLYLMLLDYYIMIYSNKRFYEETIKIYYDVKVNETVINLLLDHNNNDFGFILLHYFNKKIGICKNDVENFEHCNKVSKDNMIRLAYKKILNHLWQPFSVLEK